MKAVRKNLQNPPAPVARESSIPLQMPTAIHVSIHRQSRLKAASQADTARLSSLLPIASRTPICNETMAAAIGSGDISCVQILMAQHTAGKQRFGLPETVADDIPMLQYLASRRTWLTRGLSAAVCDLAYRHGSMASLQAVPPILLDRPGDCMRLCEQAAQHGNAPVVVFFLTALSQGSYGLGSKLTLVRAVLKGPDTDFCHPVHHSFGQRAVYSGMLSTILSIPPEIVKVSQANKLFFSAIPMGVAGLACLEAAGMVMPRSLDLLYAAVKSGDWQTIAWIMLQDVMALPPLQVQNQIVLAPAGNLAAWLLPPDIIERYVLQRENCQSFLVHQDPVHSWLGLMSTDVCAMISVQLMPRLPGEA